MSVRLPTILGKAIGDVHQTLNQEVSIRWHRPSAPTCLTADLLLDRGGAHC